MKYMLCLLLFVGLAFAADKSDTTVSKATSKDKDTIIITTRIISSKTVMVPSTVMVPKVVIDTVQTVQKFARVVITIPKQDTSKALKDTSKAPKDTAKAPKK